MSRDIAAESGMKRLFWREHWRTMLAQMVVRTGNNVDLIDGEATENQNDEVSIQTLNREEFVPLALLDQTHLKDEIKSRTMHVTYIDDNPIEDLRSILADYTSSAATLYLFKIMSEIPAALECTPGHDSSIDDADFKRAWGMLVFFDLEEAIARWKRSGRPPLKPSALNTQERQASDPGLCRLRDQEFVDWIRAEPFPPPQPETEGPTVA